MLLLLLLLLFEEWFRELEGMALIFLVGWPLALFKEEELIEEKVEEEMRLLLLLLELMLLEPFELKLALEFWGDCGFLFFLDVRDVKPLIDWKKDMLNIYGKGKLRAAERSEKTAVETAEEAQETAQEGEKTLFASNSNAKEPWKEPWKGCARYRVARDKGNFAVALLKSPTC